MGLFDALKDKASNAAQVGVAKSKKLAEIARLKATNLSEEDNIKKAYIEIGKLYYAEHSSSPDGAYVSAFEKIAASKAVIETNNERIAELNRGDAPVEEVVATVVEVVEEAGEADFADEESKEEVPAADAAEEKK